MTIHVSKNISISYSLDKEMHFPKGVVFRHMRDKLQMKHKEDRYRYTYTIILTI